MQVVLFDDLLSPRRPARFSWSVELLAYEPEMGGTG